MAIFPQKISGASLDNFLKILIYKTNESSLLILHESFYHPQFEAYNQGNTRSVGYNTSRISVYDLTTGKLTAQKEMGRMDSTEACIVLGCINEDLWIYSKKNKSGLQSFDPQTLEKKISQAYIYTHLKQDIGRFTEPNWFELNQFYAFEPIQHKLIVTNHLNEKYLLDAEQFCAEKLLEPIVLNPTIKQKLKNAARFKEDVWKFEGFDLLTLTNSQQTFNKCTFRNGQFILETNFHRLFLHYIRAKEAIELDLKIFSNREIKDNELTLKASLENQLLETNKNLTILLSGRKPDDVLLTANQESFFVFSKSEDSDASFIEISKISVNEQKEAKTDWSTPISGMFYNVSTARNTREFKTFFGDFPPLNDEIHFELIDYRMIIIYQSQVCCLNTNSGIIEWGFSIR